MYISDQTRLEMEAGAARLESVKRLQQEVQAVMNAVAAETTQPAVMVEQPAPEKPSVVVAPVVVADMPSPVAPPVVVAPVVPEAPPVVVAPVVPEAPAPAPAPEPVPEFVKLAMPEVPTAEPDAGKRRPRTKVDVEPVTAPPQPVTQ